jgi:PIN domain nuclease of toxin-antitoxin system
MPTRDTAGAVLLLDTHIRIWLLNGDPALRGSPALPAIEAAAQQAQIGVAVISVWEVGMLEAKSRIVLPMDGRLWVEKALGAPGVRLIPLSPDIAMQSTRLPGTFHGDPADRMLVATARCEGCVLVTRDQRILDYGAQGLLRVLAA